jgi:hypothetical protein
MIQRKYKITGSIITPIAFIFLIFAKDAIIPTGVEIKKIRKPNQPVNRITRAASPANTPAHNLE